MPQYLAENPETIIAMAYFDLDLHAPTRYLIDVIQPHLTRGSILEFDELRTQSGQGRWWRCAKPSVWTTAPLWVLVVRARLRSRSRFSRAGSVSVAALRERTTSTTGWFREMRIDASPITDGSPNTRSRRPRVIPDLTGRETLGFAEFVRQNHATFN